MVARPHSLSGTTAKTLQRSCLLALLGLLCLSNVFVQGQVTTPAVPPAATSSQGPIATGTPTGTTVATGTNVATGTGSAPAPTVSRSPQDPVSFLTMLYPMASEKNPPLLPIGVDIPFAWDYDNNLKLQPTNITIEAYLPDSPLNIITIGNALPGTTKNYTWTAASQKNITNPLRTAIYTLRIYDGAVGRLGLPPAGGGGYLSTYTGLKFGLYIPEPYTPGSQQYPSVCATCEFSKVTNNGVRTLLPILTVLMVTVFSTLALLL
ncbi:hypothetical protein BGZ99_006352 [Dissophora globulifera]|uniref:DUF7137 domain-containing protein n=1 Tax=Dissophora globulifera TaxID=979702 RepID=A0A9P6USJ2_9FUNG|nr:hypothetical protein BGZ99_006352 [Dissophora globulifera]